LNLSERDDLELVAILAGRRAAKTAGQDPLLSGAVGELYDRYGRLVYSVAFNATGDPHAAEEITQDVFIRAWEGAPSYRPEIAKVSTWLVSIARHRAIDELRKHGSRPASSPIDWTDESGTEEVLRISGPEDEVQDRLEQRALRQMMAELPPDQRQMLNLAFFQGLSHSQIAEELSEPLGTVKSRIRLAMKKLRGVLVERGLIDP
jgi:RNA polymerase sigma-70 factor, ECF subfamily